MRGNVGPLTAAFLDQQAQQQPQQYGPTDAEMGLGLGRWGNVTQGANFGPVTPAAPGDLASRQIPPNLQPGITPTQMAHDAAMGLWQGLHQSPIAGSMVLNPAEASIAALGAHPMPVNRAFNPYAPAYTPQQQTLDLMNQGLSAARSLTYGPLADAYQGGLDLATANAITPAQPMGFPGSNAGSLEAVKATLPNAIGQTAGMTFGDPAMAALGHGLHVVAPAAYAAGKDALKGLPDVASSILPPALAKARLASAQALADAHAHLYPDSIPAETGNVDAIHPAQGPGAPPPTIDGYPTNPTTAPAPETAGGYSLALGAAPERPTPAGNPNTATPPDVIPAPAVARPLDYATDPADINAKTWYHGTGTDGLTPESLDPNMTKIDGLFGHGIYLTDNPEIAGGYATAARNRRGTPTTYEAGVNIGKVIDLEKPMPGDALARFQQAADSLDHVGDGELRAAVDHAAKQPGATGQDVYGAFSKALGEDSTLSKGDMQEAFQDLSGNLREDGYDAYTHVGGARTGHDPHQTLILLDPNDHFGATKDGVPVNSPGRIGQVTRLDPIKPGNIDTVPVEQGRGAAPTGSPRGARSFLQDETGGTDWEGAAREAKKAAQMKQAIQAESTLRAAGDTTRADIMLDRIRKLTDAQGDVHPDDVAGVKAQLRNRPRKELEAKALSQKIANLSAIEKRFRDRGDTENADRYAQHVQDLSDARALVDDRPDFKKSPQSVTLTDRSKVTNRDKLALSPEANLKMDQLEKEWIAENGDKKRVTEQRIRDEAAAKWGPEVLEGAPKLGTGETMHPARYHASQEYLGSLTHEIVNHEEALTTARNTLAANRNTMSHADIDAELKRHGEAEARITIMERDAKQLLDDMGLARSQNGRNLAFLKIVNRNSFSPDYWLNRAVRLHGGALPGPVQAEIRRALMAGEAAKGAGDTAGVRSARIALAKAMSKVEQDGLVKTLVAVRKAGLISSPKTIGKVTLSHWGLQGLEGASKVPAAAADALISLGTGQRSVLMPTAGKVFAAKRIAMYKTWHDGFEIMRHGMTLDQLAALQIPRELNSNLPGHAIINTLVNGVFRVHGAAYRGFGIYAATRSLQDSAMLLAREDMRAGRGIVNSATGRPDLAATAEHHFQNPTPDMQATAAYDALCATFSEPNKVSDEWAKAKASLYHSDSVSGHALAVGMDQVVPFSHIPTNVCAKVLDYAVVGGLARSLAIPIGRFAKLTTGALTAAEQRTISMAIGRGSIGAGLMLMGAYLGSKGLMTGTYDAGKREMNEVAGKADGAIKILGRWVPLNSLSPLGNMLVIGATIAESKAKGWSDLLPTLASVGVNTVADQPFATGVSDLAALKGNAVKGSPKYVASQAGSFVPTILGDTASALDPNKRAISHDGIGATVRDTIESKIPGLRNTLPIKQDALGHDVPNERSGAEAFNPIAWTKSNEMDPAIHAMLENGARLPAAPTHVSIDGTAFPLSEARQRELAQKQGESIKGAVQDLIKDPDWDKGLGPDERTDTIQQAIRGGHAQAHGEYLDANAAAITREAPHAADIKAQKRDLGRQPVASGIETLLPGAGAGANDATRNRLIQQAAGRPL